MVPEAAEDGAGIAKLTDFGIARLADAAALTRTGDVVGTIAYMAPEQAEGRRVTGAADLYSLALVLYEALSGTNPIRAEGAAATARRVGMELPPLRPRAQGPPAWPLPRPRRRARPRPAAEGRASPTCAPRSRPRRTTSTTSPAWWSPGRSRRSPNERGRGARTGGWSRCGATRCGRSAAEGGAERRAGRATAAGARAAAAGRAGDAAGPPARGARGGRAGRMGARHAARRRDGRAASSPTSTRSSPPRRSAVSSRCSRAWRGSSPLVALLAGLGAERVTLVVAAAGRPGRPPRAAPGDALVAARGGARARRDRPRAASTRRSPARRARFPPARRSARSGFWWLSLATIVTDDSPDLDAVAEPARRGAGGAVGGRRRGAAADRARRASSSSTSSPRPCGRRAWPPRPAAIAEALHYAEPEGTVARRGASPAASRVLAAAFRRG